MICNQRKLFSYNIAILFKKGIDIFSDQNLPASASSHSTRIALSVWCLISVVLVCFYTTTLISFLTVPKLKSVVSSIEELANHSRLKVAVSKGTIFDALFMVKNIVQ